MNKRVLIWTAVYGIPATVALEVDGVVGALVDFCRGHVFTDNTNAEHYARQLANKNACEVVRNP